MLKLLSVFLSFALLLGFLSILSVSPVAAQAGGAVDRGLNAARADGVPDNLTGGEGSIIKKAVDLMLYAVVVLSVIMIIFGGVRYVVSGGKKESITAAKNTILYAVVGLLVAIFANAIIQFVLTAAIGGGGTDI